MNKNEFTFQRVICSLHLGIAGHPNWLRYIYTKFRISNDDAIPEYFFSISYTIANTCLFIFCA